MIALSLALDGVPMTDGRYVAFVPLEQIAPNGHYVEPIIAVWHGGKWHTADKRSIVGYAGPIPVHKFDDFFPARVSIEDSAAYQAAVTQRAQEYDL